MENLIKVESVILPHGKISYQVPGKSFSGSQTYWKSQEVKYGVGVVTKTTAKAFSVKFMHEEKLQWIPFKAVKNSYKTDEGFVDVELQFWFGKMIGVSPAGVLDEFIDKAKDFKVDSYKPKKLNHIVDIHKLDWDPASMIFSTTSDELKSEGYEPMVFDGDYRKWVGKKIYDLYNFKTKKNIRFIESVFEKDESGNIISESYKPYFKKGSDRSAIKKLENMELIIFHDV